MSLRRSILSCPTWRSGLTRPLRRLQSTSSVARAEGDEYDELQISSQSGSSSNDVSDNRLLKSASHEAEAEIVSVSHSGKVIKHEEVILNLAKATRPRQGTGDTSEMQDEFDWARETAAYGMLNGILKSGRHPSIAVLEAVLDLATQAGNDYHMQKLLTIFEEYWLPLSTKSISIVGQHYCDVEAYEQCFAFFERQIKAGREIPAESWLTLTRGLLRAGAMDVALQTLQRLEGMSKRNPSLANSPATIYLALTSFSDAYHLKGAQWSWHRALQSRYPVNLDMGACTKVLNVCGRYGLPILATEVLQYMDSQGMALFAYHYAALIESYCVAGDVKNAFMILTIMREAGVAPTSTTAGAILEFMSTDVALIDRAYFTLQDLRASGAKIDIAALNAIIDACVGITDISRAVATFQDYKSLEVQPNIDTMNSLLTGCVAVSQKDLTLSLIKLFREELRVTADSRTYTLLISVCILQENYEDCFRYLEEMKEEGHQPSIATYELLIRRCVSANDTRADVAYDEMKGWGYRSRDIDNLMRYQRRAVGGPIDPSSAGVLKIIQSMTRPETWFTPQ